LIRAEDEPMKKLSATTKRLLLITRTIRALEASVLPEVAGGDEPPPPPPHTNVCDIRNHAPPR
jgi:hypothetical protein